MKKGIILFFIIFCTKLQAQKKYFFDRIYFSGLVGNSVYQVDRSEWKNLYANRESIPYLLDTMQAGFIAKDGFSLRIDIKGAAGISVGKQLINTTKKWWHNRELEWRTSLFYKATRYSPSNPGYLDNYGYMADTTRVGMKRFVNLEQEKQIIEWQNLINYKTGHIIFKKMRFVIGNGFGISSTVQNSIHEKYKQTSYTWNSGQRRFDEQILANTDKKFKAKPETLFSYIFYLATEFRFSPQVLFFSDFHYTIAKNPLIHFEPKIESYWVGMGFSYSF
jgi:hypothetical protein